MGDETVAWEGFRGAGLISEDGVRRGVGVSGREVAGAHRLRYHQVLIVAALRSSAWEFWGQQGGEGERAT